MHDIICACGRVHMRDCGLCVCVYTGALTCVFVHAEFIHANVCYSRSLNSQFPLPLRPLANSVAVSSHAIQKSACAQQRRSIVAEGCVKMKVRHNIRKTAICPREADCKASPHANTFVIRLPTTI